MERITSRKNQYIAHLRALASSGEYRREKGEFVLDGEKLLREALSNGAEVKSVLWSEESHPLEGDFLRFTAPRELVEYASPVKQSPGPVFTVAIRETALPEVLSNAVVLENVQDPGNVGTAIRTADAFGIGAVILAGECADVYSPRAARATMGAVFRERVIKTAVESLPELLERYRLPLYGAALAEDAEDIRALHLQNAAVAVGNEGHGLSPELLSLCEKKLIIPISPKSESLNAAMAAAVIMWEMTR